MMRRTGAKLGLLLALLIFVGTFHYSSSTAAGILSVYFFEARGNSGYEAVLIQTPDGTNVVIDSGADVDGNEFSRFLAQQGVGRIDYLFASNAGPGYVGLHDDLIWQFGQNIDKVVEVGQSASNRQYQDYIETACAHGVEIMIPRDGDSIRWGSVKVSFFSPSEMQLDWRSQKDVCSAAYESDAVSGGTYSLVFKIEYGDVSYLFTGDLGGEELDELLERHSGDLKSTILKLPRSGGELGPSAESFLSAISPTTAVAMASPLDSMGRPCDTLLQQLGRSQVETYVTGLHGTISMYSDGQMNIIETIHDVTTDPTELESRNSSAGDC